MPKILEKIKNLFKRYAKKPAHPVGGKGSAPKQEKPQPKAKQPQADKTQQEPEE